MVDGVFGLVGHHAPSRVEMVNIVVLEHVTSLYPLTAVASVLVRERKVRRADQGCVQVCIYVGLITLAL